MPDILDLDPFHDKFMCLLTGHNGSGKSVLIGSWLKKGPIYFFDFDGRMAAVSNWYRQRGAKKGDLTYDSYGPMRVYNKNKELVSGNVYDAVTKLKEFIEIGCPYTAIAIDSFTAVTVSAVMYQLNQRQGKGQGHKDAPSFSKGDLIIPDWDEYKGETVYVTLLLDMCKALAASGVAVFWTAHPITSTKIEVATKPGERDSYGKQTRYAAYGNKADSLIPIYFNEIWHLTSRFDWGSSISRRYVWTAPREEVNAKTALNLPSEIDWTGDNPNSPTFYDILMDLLAKQRGEENEISETNKTTQTQTETKENNFGLF